MQKIKKEYTLIRRVYAWVGFLVIWFMVGFVIWSLLVGTDQTINTLIKIFN
jgi:hypothetical protein